MTDNVQQHDEFEIKQEHEHDEFEIKNEHDEFEIKNEHEDKEFNEKVAKNALIMARKYSIGKTKDFIKYINSDRTGDLSRTFRKKYRIEIAEKRPKDDEIQPGVIYIYNGSHDEQINIHAVHLNPKNRLVTITENINTYLDSNTAINWSLYYAEYMRDKNSLLLSIYSKDTTLSSDNSIIIKAKNAILSEAFGLIADKYFTEVSLDALSLKDKLQVIYDLGTMSCNLKSSNEILITEIAHHIMMIQDPKQEIFIAKYEAALKFLMCNRDQLKDLCEIARCLFNLRQIEQPKILCGDSAMMFSEADNVDISNQTVDEMISNLATIRLCKTIASQNEKIRNLEETVKQQRVDMKEIAEKMKMFEQFMPLLKQLQQSSNKQKQSIKKELVFSNKKRTNSSNNKNLG